MLQRITLVFIVSVLLNSCKEGPPQIKNSEPTSFEESYFEDYDEPRYKWGYINEKGELVIKGDYDALRDFSEGLAMANYEGRWGYIDINGSNVIPHQYVSANNFQDGLALVEQFDNVKYFIDKTGTKAFELENVDKIKGFDQGLALFERKGSWGAIDTQGKVIIEPNFEKIKIVDKDILICRKAGKYGVINRQSEELASFEYQSIRIGDEFPMVAKKDGRSMILGENFKSVGKTYKSIGAFYNGKAVAKDGSIFLLGANGKELKEFDYEDVQTAGEGMWKYKVDKNWGILDEEGEVVTEPKYLLLNRFKEEKIAFGMSDDEWGYLNKDGSVLMDPILPLVWDYHNGMARFITRGGVGFLGLDGKIKIKPQFFEVRDFNDGLARVQIYR